jgi:nucleotide-binding universal stress UspA family protein
MAAAKKGGRPCTVCHHPLVSDIDRHIVRRSMTYPTMASKYDLSQDALRRHRDAHITEEAKRAILLDAKVAKQEAAAAALTGERVEIDSGLRRIVAEIDRILQRAKANGDDLLALGSLKEMRTTLLALAKLHGQLSQELTVTVNLNESPQFLTLRKMIMRVLDRHPEAKTDFLEEMRRLQIGHG